MIQAKTESTRPYLVVAGPNIQPTKISRIIQYDIGIEIYHPSFINMEKDQIFLLNNVEWKISKAVKLMDNNQNWYVYVEAFRYMDNINPFLNAGFIDKEGNKDSWIYNLDKIEIDLNYMLQDEPIPKGVEWIRVEGIDYARFSEDGQYLQIELGLASKLDISTFPKTLNKIWVLGKKVFDRDWFKTLTPDQVLQLDATSKDLKGLKEYLDNTNEKISNGTPQESEPSKTVKRRRQVRSFRTIEE